MFSEKIRSFKKGQAREAQKPEVILTLFHVQVHDLADPFRRFILNATSLIPIHQGGEEIKQAGKCCHGDHGKAEQHDNNLPGELPWNFR